MRQAAAALSVLVALGLSACGQTSSATEFEGEESVVAQVVEDLESSGKRGEADDICNNLFAKTLQEKIAAANATCPAELKKALEDTDTFDLEVQDVTITGTTATARVKGTDEGDGTLRTFRLAKERAGWRIADIAAAG